MRYDHLVLDRLLKRYERSAHYRQTAAAGRRVMLRLGPDSRDLPEYDIESIEARQAMNSAVRQLAADGLVAYEWERYQQDIVLSKVWLLLDQADAAYARLGRATGAGIARGALGQIKVLLDSLAEPADAHTAAALNRLWVEPALQEMQERISATWKLSPLLPEDPRLADDLLQVLDRITRREFIDTALRVFSSRYFLDSKHFEKNLRGRLLSLIRRFHPQLADHENGEFLSDDDVMRLAGIYRNPEIFEFCGPLFLTFRGPDQQLSAVDFSVFLKGASLRSSNVADLAAVDASRVLQLLFIENRTNYEAYIQTERQPFELVVFHGGFHGLVKQQFFSLIAASLPETVPIRHWGDIDLGGMRIFLQIRQNIAPLLRPWRMDHQTLLAYRRQAIPFSPAYRKELEKAIADLAFAEFTDVLAAMLELGVRLEQESLIGQIKQKEQGI